MMPNRLIKTLFLSPIYFLGLLISTASAQLPEPETPRVAEIKSYFLLKLNLDTDPVDLQNYLDKREFMAQIQATAKYCSGRLLALQKPQFRTIQWAIARALDGDVDLAITELTKLEQDRAILQDKIVLKSIYQLLSQLLELKMAYREAIVYQQKIVELAQKQQRKTEAARSLMKLGELYSLAQDTAQAEYYLIKKALSAFNQLRDRQGMIHCYHEIADSYARNRQLTQARWFYVQSLIMARKINYSAGILVALNELGELKYKSGDYVMAASDWQEAEQLAIINHDLPVLLKLKYSLANAFKVTQNQYLADRYALEFDQLREILLNPI